MNAWMMGYLVRRLPTHRSIRSTLAYTWFGDTLLLPDYWAPRRHSIAMGLGLGWCIGLLPIYGFHTGMALLAGARLRCHLPSVVLGTHISNPMTLPAILMLQYLAGAWVGASWGILPQSTPGWMTALASAFFALILGALGTAVAMGAAGYCGTWLFLKTRKER